MNDRIKVTFDESHQIRVFEADKFKQTKDLEEECTEFLSKIRTFSETATGLVGALEEEAEKIDRVKMKAIGQRNRLQAEKDVRARRKQQLKVLIAERNEEIKRLQRQHETLLRVEQEQAAMLERLNDNEV